MNVQHWRRHFPALQSNFAYFDNAGGSQTLKTVADRVHEYLLSSNVQHGASYSVAMQARDRVSDAINRLRKFVNARHLHEVLLGPSSTQLTANIALAMKPLLQAGDTIILTNTEHEANAGPWKRLAESVGASVHYWSVNPQTWRLDVTDLEKLITPRTRLIAMCQVSNILGAVNPVQEVVRIARANNILTCIDAVACAPHMATDVQALDCDMLTMSLYKIFGPHIGLMYVRDELQQKFATVNHSHISAGNVPYRFLPGGVCYELAYGAGAIVDYLEEIGGQLNGSASARQKIIAAYDAFNAHEEKLTAQFLQFLSGFERVRIIGPRADDLANRVGTISFTVKGASPESICLAVDEHAIGIRHGVFHTVKLMQDNNLLESGGVVRASLAHYTTADEVQRLMTALRPLLA